MSSTKVTEDQITMSSIALSDIVIASIGDGEILVYNLASEKWNNNTLAEAGIAASDHSHNVADLTDVTITDIASGEILKWNGTAWINNTAEELGFAEAEHNHDIEDITDVQIISLQTDDLLKYNGTKWVNKSLADAGIAAASHSHVINDISNINIVSIQDADILVYNSTSEKWENNTIADAGIAVASHSHNIDDLTNITIASISDGEILVYDSGESKWLNKTLSEIDILTKSGGTVTGALVLQDSLSLMEVLETVNISVTAYGSGTNIDLKTGAVFFNTDNASSNPTFNFRGNSGTALNSVMSIGQSITCTIIITNDTVAYYPTAFSIDGSSVTPEWIDGNAPESGNASSKDAYTFTIIKTANEVFTVLASTVSFS